MANDLKATANSKFERALVAGALRLGLRIDGDALDRLLAHFELLVRWSAKMNLTTVRDPVQMAARLYLDSLIPAERLAEGASLHDVGCGAGFPGMILKACRPGLRVTLTEARRRKTTFLKQAARRMGLHDGLEIRWQRVGWDDDQSNEFDEVMSRAAFPPAEWLKLGAKMVGRAGRLWLFAGQPHGAGDIEQLGSRRWILDHIPDGFELEKIQKYELADAKLERVLVSYRRK